MSGDDVCQQSRDTWGSHCLEQSLQCGLLCHQLRVLKQSPASQVTRDWENGSFRFGLTKSTMTSFSTWLLAFCNVANVTESSYHEPAHLTTNRIERRSWTEELLVSSRWSRMFSSRVLASTQRCCKTGRPINIHSDESFFLARRDVTLHSDRPPARKCSTDCKAIQNLEL